MDSFISDHLSISHDEAIDLIGNRSDIELLDYLLALKNPPKPVTSFKLRLARPHLEAEKLRIPLREWAAQHNISKVIDEMSFLELKAMRINPFYLLFAFGVNFDICCKLQQELGVVLSSPQIVAHAKLWSILINTPMVYVEEAHSLIREQCSVEVRAGLEALEIFPASLLERHPLADFDPYLESSATLRKHIKDFRAVLSTIRERKFLQNRIYVARGKYMIHDRSKQFVDAFLGIYSRASALENAISKKYKRMKSE